MRLKKLNANLNVSCYLPVNLFLRISPQCSGPRRRYAKKVGDVVGTTLDGGDAPILLFSFGGVIATILFGIWAVDNL